MDVKNAFMYVDLHNEVYLSPSLSLPYQPGYVCRLYECIYGLHQSCRCWFEKFSEILDSLGFRSSHLFVGCTIIGPTHCLYILMM